MYSNVKPKTPFEVIPVDSYDIWCDGGSVALGHPRVFLHLEGDKGEIVCPYCSRTYVYHPDGIKG